MSDTSTDTPNWRNRIVGSGEMMGDQFLANPRNAHLHSLAQQRAMTEVLDDIGFVLPVLVNRTTGALLDGHMRVALAISKGTTVPYVEVELSLKEEMKVLATLDPLGSMGSWDREVMSDLLSEFEVEDPALAALLAGLSAAPHLGGSDSDPGGEPDWPSYGDDDGEPSPPSGSGGDSSPPPDPEVGVKSVILAFDTVTYDEVMGRLNQVAGQTNTAKVLRLLREATPNYGF